MTSESHFLYPPNARCGVWITHADWTGWTLDRCAASAAGVTPDAGTAAAASPEVETGHPFSNLVASWNADTPPGTSIEADVRARIGDRWTNWYIMGRWAGPGTGSSVDHQKDADGDVDVDTLRLNAPANAAQMRVRFTGAGDTVARLTLASLCWENPAAPAPAPPALVDGWARTLPVPPSSQMVQACSNPGSICSPTSLSMVLRYCGVACQPLDAVRGVHDTASDMYGNWPLNTAYAGSCGCPSFVARFTCLEQVQNEIAAGHPVITSIRFSKGELAGAPISRSRGHLVVVVGFTPAGNVVVNDPAAPSEASVRRVYLRDQFTHAWIGGSGGIVYLVAPEKRGSR